MEDKPRRALPAGGSNPYPLQPATFSPYQARTTLQLLAIALLQTPRPPQSAHAILMQLHIVDLQIELALGLRWLSQHFDPVVIPVPLQEEYARLVRITRAAITAAHEDSPE